MSLLGDTSNREEQIRRTLDAWARCGRARGAPTQGGPSPFEWLQQNPIAREERGTGAHMRSIERTIGGDVSKPRVVIRKMDASSLLGTTLKNEIVIARQYQDLQLGNDRPTDRMPRIAVLAEEPSIGVEQDFAGIDLQDFAFLLERNNPELLANARMHLALWLGVLDALDALHQMGWVHADARPDNFCIPVAHWDGSSLTVQPDAIKAIDFGLTLLAPRQRAAQRESFLAIRGCDDFPRAAGVYHAQRYRDAFAQAFGETVTAVATGQKWSAVDALDRRVDWEAAAFFVRQIYCDEADWNPGLVPFPRFSSEAAGTGDAPNRTRALQSLRGLPELLLAACQTGDRLDEKFAKIRAQLKRDLGDYRIDPISLTAPPPVQTIEIPASGSDQPATPPAASARRSPLLWGGLALAGAALASAALVAQAPRQEPAPASATGEKSPLPAAATIRSPDGAQASPAGSSRPNLSSPITTPAPARADWRGQKSLIANCNSMQGEFHRALLERRRPNADKLRESLAACGQLRSFVPDDEVACKALIGLFQAQLARDLGEYGRALELAEASVMIAPAAYEPHLLSATVHALRQEPDAAFAELAHARAKGWRNLKEVDATELPYLRPYRKDARYIRLKAELGPGSAAITGSLPCSP